MEMVKVYVDKGRFQHSKRVLRGNGKGSGGFQKLFGGLRIQVG